MEQIYKGEYMVVPSIFTHAEQEDLMKKLQWELSRCMSRAGLWRERGPAELPSRCQRHSWGLGEEEQALEEEWQNGQSKYGRRTHSRGRSGLRLHQSPSPSCSSWCQSPSLALHNPVPLMSGFTAPWRILELIMPRGTCS